MLGLKHAHSTFKQIIKAAWQIKRQRHREGAKAKARARAKYSARYVRL